MPIYIRFDNNRQVETTCLNRKPGGKQWLKAPSTFDWHTCYCLSEDHTIQVRTQADIDQTFLSHAKAQGKLTIARKVDQFRRLYAGHSFEKSESYRIQAAAATRILSADNASRPLDDDDVAVVKPLADLRRLSVTDMATRILTKHRQAKRAMVVLEACEDQLLKHLAQCETIEAVQARLAKVDSQIQTALQQGTADA